MARRIDLAEFVTSATSARDLPRDGRPEVAMVGRSNVGKSTLINALVRKDIARTSATPGKTRLVNIYRVQQLPGDPFYVVDLPGYGHASGGAKAREEFAGLIGGYFEARMPNAASGFSRTSPSPAEAAFPEDGVRQSAAGQGFSPAQSPLAGCILAIDARHPGLSSDVEALRWLSTVDAPSLLVATKADKLSQSENARLRRECEAAFGQPPLIVSALKGDGLDELWRRIRDWTSA
jgi:GTP-binding protein